MKRARFLRGAVIAMACTNLVLPKSAFAEVPNAGHKPAVQPAATVTDVALGERGLLLGQVVDAQGAALKNAPVTILQNDKQVVTTKADAEGRFAVQGLRGGTYQIATKDGVSVCRLWAHDTAPPTAQGGALVCSGGALRGNYGGCMYWLTNPWVIAGLVATAIAVPIIIHNRDDDDDDEDSGS